jgi:hypothetical protein
MPPSEPEGPSSLTDPLGTGASTDGRPVGQVWCHGPTRGYERRRHWALRQRGFDPQPNVGDAPRESRVDVALDGHPRWLSVCSSWNRNWLCSLAIGACAFGATGVPIVDHS